MTSILIMRVALKSVRLTPTSPSKARISSVTRPKFKARGDRKRSLNSSCRMLLKAVIVYSPRSRSPSRRIRGLSFNESGIKAGISSVGRHRQEKSLTLKDDKRSLTPMPAVQKAKRLLEAAKEKYEGLDFTGAYTAADEAFRLDCEEAQLYRGLSLLKLNEPERACKDLNAVLTKTPSSDVRLYQGLSECNSLSLDERLMHLNKGIELFSDSADLYMRRAQAFLEAGKADRAIADCQTAIDISGPSGQAYIVKGDAFRLKGDLQTAYTSYTRAVQYPKAAIQALVSRAQLNLQLHELSAASHDINMVGLTQILRQQPQHPEGLFYRGLLLLRQEKDNEAGLILEQSVKYADPAKATEALYYISYLKTKQRDFYGALRSLERIRVATPQVSALKSYLEAIVILIKRKYVKAVKLLTALASSSLLTNMPIPCEAYRAYAHSCLNNYAEAVKDFEFLEKVKRTDVASQFNHALCLGMMAVIDKDFSKAAIHFSIAHSCIESNVEPMVFLALILVERSQREKESKESILEAIEKLSEALSYKKVPEVYYVRAVLYHSVDDFAAALEDIDEVKVNQVISRCDSPSARHYMLRGECNALLGRTEEALQDYSFASEIDEDSAEAFYFRACCSVQLDDLAAAFNDLQKVISTAPVRLSQNAVWPHVKAGHLLMLNQSWPEAVKAYANANTLEPSYEANFYMAAANLELHDFKSAELSLKTSFALSPSKTSLQSDIKALELFLQLLDSLASDQSDLSEVRKGITELLCVRPSFGMFSERYLHWYKGMTMLYSGQYSKAITVRQSQEFQFAISQPLSPSADIDVAARENELLVFNLALSCLIVRPSQSDKAQEGCNLLVELSERGTEELRGRYLFIVAQVLPDLALKQLKPNETLETLEPSLYTEVAENPSVLEVDHENDINRVLKPLQIDTQGKTLVRSSQLCRPCLRPPHCRPDMKVTKHDAWAAEITVAPIQLDLVTPKFEPPWVHRTKGSIQFTEAMIDQQISVSVSSTSEPSSYSELSSFEADM